MHFVTVRTHTASALGFVLFEPCEGLVETIEFAKLVDPRVSNDTDARRSTGQRNQPHPVALAHQVIRTQPTSRHFTSQCLPTLIIAPSVNLNGLVNAEPDGIDIVTEILGKIKFALQETRSTAGVNDPAST